MAELSMEHGVPQELEHRVGVARLPRVGKGPSGRFRSLSELLDKRTDLRGTYAPADYLEEAIRWSA